MLQLLFVGAAFAVAPGVAEPDSAEPDPTPSAEARPRRFAILPLPTFDYTPETGFSGGAVVLVTGRPFVDARPASFGIEGALTTEGQRILETDLLLFTPSDRVVIDINVDVLRFPEDFWGVGPDTPASDRERLETDRIEVEADVLAQVWSSLYLGPIGRLQSVYNLTPAPGGILDAGDVVGAGGGLSAGLGAAAVWERRARPLTPAAGEQYVALRSLMFRPGLGSDFTFSRFEADARAYLQIGAQMMLALQGYAQLHTGAPPFRMLSLLGGEELMRGYYRGRYRDQHLVATQAELRAPLFWRLGAVAFVGVGDVAPRLADLSFASIKPTVGGGLRVRVDDTEQTNLRIDLAGGRDAFGVYFSFGEAF
ncbi:MAG: BamA/TamA family outer membrane protein [Myxococcota bacterium]